MSDPVAQHTGSAASRAQLLARFTVVMSAQPERRALTIADRRFAEQSRATLMADPEYASWPPDGFGALRLDRGPIDLVVLARAKAALDFGARLEGVTRDGLHAAIRRTWPKVLPTGHYGRVTGEAVVYADGRVEWGYTFGGTSAPALPLDSVVGLRQAAGRSSLDLYVQNMLRMEVLAEAAGFAP